MGTWDPTIKGNDTSSDVYDQFFQLYDEGHDPSNISKRLIDENGEVLSDTLDANNFWFALALAQWETKSLDPELYKKVKEIIEKGRDLNGWRQLDGSVSDVARRKDILDKFLQQISVERSKPKARKNTQVKAPIFEKGDCITFKMNNGQFGGAVVLEADYESGFGYNLVATTRINLPREPNLTDFEEAEVLILSFGDWTSEPKITWYLPDHYPQYSAHYKVVGSMEVERSYSLDDDSLNASFSGGWQLVKESIEMQLDHEAGNPKPGSLPLRNMTMS